MKRYFQYLKEYKWRCIFGTLSKWIEAVLELLVPIVMARIIDVGVANEDLSYVLWGGAVMLAMGAVGFFCAVYCQRSASSRFAGVRYKRSQRALPAHQHALVPRIG